MDFQLLFKYEDSSLICNHCVKKLRPFSSGDPLYDEHYHELYEIIFVRTGTMDYCVGGQRFPITANSLIFTRPGITHAICSDTDSVYDRIDLLFDPKIIPGDYLEQIPADVHVLEIAGNPIILQLFDRLRYYADRLSGPELQRVLYALVGELVMDLALALQPRHRQPDPELSEIMQNVQSYIHAHLLSITDIDTICTTLGISKSYLHRLFVQELGITPKRYISQHRLNLAQWEISNGTKASAIYEKYGFSDYSAFYRAYSKQFGYAPSDTRQSAFQNARK